MTVTSSPIVTLSYEDLISFQKGNKDEKSQLLMNQIGQAYGSDGLGILTVSGIPNFTELRQRLLPLAAKIPQLPPDELAKCVSEESCYSVGWSHGKEELAPGVKDLSKGSYYANPLVNNLGQAMLERQRNKPSSSANDTLEFEQQLHQLVQENPAFFAPNLYPDSMPELEAAIADMGQSVARVGRLISRVADAYCEQHGVQANLETILNESLNCKGRLLHYFAATPNNNDDNNEWWCGWHNDHGSLTGLIPAMYLTDTTQEPTSCPDPTAGLYIQSRTKQLVKAKLPSDCMAFQIGETFQILTGGLLQATPHAVKQASAGASVTRETFAVFMEPEFDFPLELPPNRTIEDCCKDDAVNQSLRLNSIRSRWKPGMNFGTFHNVTVQTFHSQLDAKEV